MKLNELNRGSILYLDYRTLHASPEGRNGSVSLVSGIPFENGVIALRLRGHRHEVAYGPEAHLYTLTQEALDAGVEGVLLGPEHEEYPLVRQELLNRASNLAGIGVEGRNLAMRGR